MTATVTLVTDRPAFVPVWRDVLERHAFAVRVHAPSDLWRFAVLGRTPTRTAASATDPPAATKAARTSTWRGT